MQKTLAELVPKTEAEEEATFVRKARAKGYMCRKMNGEGYRGWPDQLVEGIYPNHWYIEFKRPGKYKNPNDGLSVNQAKIIGELRARQIPVLVTDSADNALKFIGAL